VLLNRVEKKLLLHNLHVGLGRRRATVRLVARLVWEEQAARRLELRMGADAITYGPVDVSSVVALLCAEVEIWFDGKRTNRRSGAGVWRRS
jgi:hypothetical protein